MMMKIKKLKEMKDGMDKGDKGKKGKKGGKEKGKFAPDNIIDSVKSAKARYAKKMPIR